MSWNYVLIEVPAWLAIAGIVIAIGAVPTCGIAESAVQAVIATVIESGGLLPTVFVS